LRLTEGEGAAQLSPVQQASLYAVRGELALRAGATSDASRFATRATELGSTDRLVSMRCLELTLAAGQFDAAAALAKSLLARNAKDEIAIVGLARAKLGSRDLLGAYTDVQGALTASPDSPTLNFWLGVVSKAMGKRDEAKAQFQKARTLDPKAHEPAVELAMDAVEHGKYQEAMTIADEAAAVVPPAERWRMVGVKAHVLSRKRAFVDAEAAYQDALKARPSAAGVRGQYVDMLVAAGRLTEAEQQLGEAQLLDPKNTQVLLAAGVVATARGNHNAALERATEAMQLAPSWYLPFARAARAAAQLKDAARARGYVEIADRLLHGAPDVLCAQAAVAITNDPKTAVSLLQEAREAAPDDPNIAYELGRGHTEAGNFLDAIEVLKKLIKTVPDYGDAYFALAKVNREIGRSGDAHRALEQLLKVDPKRIDAWLEAADLYASADNDAAALKAYQKAQDVDPNHAATACALGEALVVRMGDDERNLKRGVDVLRRCVELAPKEAAGWKHMGNAYLSLRKGKEAAAAFRSYLDLADPADPERVAVQESLANLKQPGG
jgi:tetratricopeptide (TPR) repeat protein